MAVLKMKSRPILYSGEMIRAILAGTKTETRRTRGLGRINEDPDAWALVSRFLTSGSELQFTFQNYDDCDFVEIKSPYGKAGDGLWCKETFVIESNWGLDSEDGYPPPFDDGRPIKRVERRNEFNPAYWEQCHYRATDPAPDLLDLESEEIVCRWRPSMFMPRWASRITQEIIGITVQRLHDMTEANAVAEGVKSLAGYKELWDSINGKKYPWAMNPWVWRIQTRSKDEIQD
jgi:hypothetical protein